MGAQDVIKAAEGPSRCWGTFEGLMCFWVWPCDPPPRSGIARILKGGVVFSKIPDFHGQFQRFLPQRSPGEP
jgi:hypothetical protein